MCFWLFSWKQNGEEEGEFCKKQSELLFSQFLKKQNNNKNSPN